MSDNYFDIVIPVHKKDLSILEYAIKFARKNIVGARRIIVISKQKYTNNAEWYDEKEFPFSFEEIAKLCSGVNVGWHFQQFLKIYSPLVIPNISNNVLILDSDTVFFKKIKMIDDQGRALINISKDKNIHESKFDINVDNHIKKILPKISRNHLPKEIRNNSGVSHHMIFNKDIIEEIIQDVEDLYFKENQKKKPFYEIALLKNDSSKQMTLSEYQIYFNFVNILHPNKIALRKLKYKNTSNSNIARYHFFPKYHYCSFHHYMRKNSEEGLLSKIKMFFK